MYATINIYFNSSTTECLNISGAIKSEIKLIAQQREFGNISCALNSHVAVLTYILLFSPWHYTPYLGFVPFIEVSQLHEIKHTVGLLWTNDQPVAEASTYTGQHNI
jgi:hypothetical protein